MGGTRNPDPDEAQRGESLESEVEDVEEEEGPRNPFDNPYFLPVLLLGLSLWFGYDGWLNTDEHMLKPSTLWFNRIGFGLLVLGGLWTLRGARRETRARKTE